MKICSEKKDGENRVCCMKCIIVLIPTPNIYKKFEVSKICKK